LTRQLAPFLLVLAFGCGAPAEAPTDIQAEEVLALLASPERPLILDVRSADEFATGRVPGAVNIPHTEVPERLGELGEPREVIVYCERGKRAAMAGESLSAAGFSVRYLEGDMSGWREAERIVER